MVVKSARSFVLLFGLALALHMSPAEAEQAKTVRVLENIYTIVHGEGIDSNTTFIITEDGVIVIDTRTTPTEARKILAEIRKKTDKPILYTINTHYHGDHTFGNQVFNESKVIIAHKNVRRALVGPNGEGHLKFFKTFKFPGMDEIVITPPNVVFEKKMNIYAGGYHLQLIHLGNGHTDGDTFILLDELKTVIAGDLIFNKKIPYAGDGYIEDWISSLDYMEKLSLEVVVPGHGDVGGKMMIFSMKHYLLDLTYYVREQFLKGKTLKETQDAVRPVLEKKYSDWDRLDWLDANIQRTFLELSTK